ncbi:MAG: peptidase M14 [Mongoliibacter sp.]|uniref:M14 family zinc carboxypeptidase n=1 Tax=Mongoliibacter sp. TaxID=2022438 RepID=UPI0012F08F65|nr:M14 family zinc carboxypeptidase [Mongoliibacter sp.]TVP48658.1 MAG: peptidase M14 [Mongoliibacter sp.]
MKANIFSYTALSLFSILILFGACQPEKKFQELDSSQLFDAYEKYKEESVSQRRFKHAEVMPLIRDRANDDFQVEEIGKSVEGRSIFQMTWGNGPTKVMLWSQMHGNESTATMALFDLSNFIEGKDDDYDELRTFLKNELTIRFIPIVNPDGMDRWIRRNALDIDLNRDAISLASPEAVLLKNARDSFSPEFGFNLHDQSTFYTVGDTEKPATISVLAPAFNYETEVNDVRKRAMQVIAGMNELLQEVVPGHVGKYNDAFEPRAFGDNIQKWGTSTILIESGGFPNDPEKQEIRKLNFLAMLHALQQIANESYGKYSLETYYAIPDNSFRLMDVIIRNLQLSKGVFQYKADIGIKRKESDVKGDFYVTGSIDDMGDLSIFYGYEELDASGFEIVQGKVFEETFESSDAISKEKSFELLREGFLAIKVKEGDELHGLPLLVLKNQTEIPEMISIGNAPNFFLAKDGELKFALVNGYLINLENPKEVDFKQRLM